MVEPTIRYDEPSDTLYISFVPGASATGIELSEHLLLRVDKQRRLAVGLTVFNYSLLAQRTEMGPRSFPLTGLGTLPEELRAVAIGILQSDPVRFFLSLSAYTPAGDATELIPITSLHLDRIAPRAA